MSSHPCRAHHKLKWARKGQSGLGVLYELIPRSESSKTIITVKNRSKAPLPSNALPPAQTPQGQPCLTGVGNNPLIVIKHHQCAVSRMPQARRSRLSLTRCAGWATLPRTSTTSRFPPPPPAQIFLPALYYIADLLYSILTRKTNDKPIYAG